MGPVFLSPGLGWRKVIDDDKNPSLTLTGTPSNDILTGGNGDDSLLGLGGNDILDGSNGSDRLTGGNGADVITGGNGADRFVYTTFSDSLLGVADRIRDFNPGQGDRIILNQLPNSVFNAGVLSTTSYTTLSDAIIAAYNRAGAGLNQALAANEAIFFGWNRRTYLSVNDSNAGFNSNSDLLIEVTGIVGNLPTGAVTSNNYFGTN